MQARRILAAILFAGSLSAHARDLRPELLVEGRTREITVSPSGALWIGTALGYAYRSDDGGRTWSEVVLPVRRFDLEAGVFRQDDLDRFTFFDARRAIVSGYIGEAHDTVLLTEDGGATWKTVRLPVELVRIYTAHATSGGHAWLGGSKGDVLHSNDFGRTWRKLARPFGDGERTNSVWFATPQMGVVGSLYSGALAITRDGGASWQAFEAKGREQVVSGCAQERDQRVDKTRLHDGRVFVKQCGGVFSAPLSGSRAWTRVTAGGKALVDFEVADGRLIGVTADRDVYGDGRSLGMRLEHPLLWVAAHGKRVAMLDATMKAAVFDGNAWHHSRMFGKGTAASWPITAMDRGAGDLLWGVSQYFLYRSTDGAKTWDRIAELPAAASIVLLQNDGNVLLADGHGWVGRWDVKAGALGNVPVLNGLDIVGTFRRADVWLAFGGRQYDTAGRVEVAQSFFRGQFSGTVAYGFVAASVDGGRTWSIVDRWNEEGPQELFLSDENRLTLLSWLCGIRQGTLSLQPPGANMQTLLRGSDRERTPYVQTARVLDLLGGKEGWIVGWIHHIGDRVYRTSDGGRTWKAAERDAYPRAAIYRLGDGTWIGFSPPLTLQRWTGKRFETLATLPADFFDARVDSTGTLLVRSKGNKMHVLDAKRGTLRALAR